MEANKIEGLALRVVEAVIAMGVSRHTAWEAYEKVFCQEVALHKTRGKELFEPELLDEVIAIAAERLDRGEIGLRAIDLARIKLADVDWQRGEIKFVQAKTDKSIALPLTRDVGEAIQDYILNGRQNTKSVEIFLRDHRPYQGFKSGVGIGKMYDAYRKRAGLPRDAFDGNGFHFLRRGVGKNLATALIPVTTIAQIFGDEKFDSTKQYIALDSVRLKECALTFVGIEPKGGTDDE